MVFKTMSSVSVRDVRQLDADDILGNNERAFSMIEQAFGIARILSPADMVTPQGPDRWAMLLYLLQLQGHLATLSSQDAHMKSNRKVTIIGTLSFLRCQVK